jgi:holo-[acyl-carrier protein] synthase
MTRWRDCEVVRGRGAPTISLTGIYAVRAEHLGITRVHVSLTHGKHSAIAFAVAEAGTGGAPRAG